MAKTQRVALAGVFAGALGLLLWGWSTFWYLTDDAFIAFRYVSNHQLGLGYVWNGPPFVPVEGYTSFSWVVLLDLVWTLTGVPPTESANVLALFFSAVTLCLTGVAAITIAKRGAVGPSLPGLVAVVLLLVVGNRAFLAATSSGLETALFNALILAWVLLAHAGTPSARRIAGLATLASLIALTRPDGLLYAAATACIAAFGGGRGAFRHLASRLVALAPLFAIAAHLLWRRSFYGEWLPNTYFAKTTGIWLESGWRYAGSFVLEFALWFGLFVMLAATVSAWRRRRVAPDTREMDQASRWSGRIAVSCVLAHAAYYTIAVGGDHFEYRVYGPLIPLFALALLRAALRLSWPPRTVGAVLALQLLIGSLIPWAHWANARAETAETGQIALFRPIAPALPAALRWYAGPFDDMQAWLIDHFVCMRHNEHQLFWLHMVRTHPSRADGSTLFEGRPHAVVVADSVGVPGWVFPTAHIIDAYGLNDYVIARTPIPPGTPRRMAHERRPPAGYLEAFRPVLYSRGASGLERPAPSAPLSAEEIIAIEARYRARVDPP